MCALRILSGTVTPTCLLSACPYAQSKLKEGARALDVGSGSGYMTACMALLVGPSGFVLGVEKVPQLAWRSVGAIQRAMPELSLR